MPQMHAWILCIFCCGILGAQELSNETTLLGRIRQKMADNLVRTPDYTCRETIERTSTYQRAHLLDRVRVEVALVNGKELFSWPGAEKFEDASLYDLVGGGTTATGDFAIFAQTVFSTNAPVFQSKREEAYHGRPAIRYSYFVPRPASQYHIRIAEKSAVAGFRGDFWADPETLEILRLEVHVAETSEELGISTADTEIEYAKVRIGSSESLLPKSVALALKLRSGEEHRNRTVFTNCRQYVGRSEIRFDDTSDTTPSAEKQITEIQLPAGLALDVRLTTPVDGEKSAVGDPITAMVAGDVKKDGVTIVPKGATLAGRIRRLEKRFGVVVPPVRTPTDLYLVGIEFSQLTFGGRRANFSGELMGIGPLGNLRPAYSGLAEPDKRAGGGLMFVRDSRLLLRAGFRMEWWSTPQPAQQASEGHMELTLKTTKPAYQEGEAIPLKLELKNMTSRSWIVAADLDKITLRIVGPNGRALKLLLVRPQAAAVKTVCELLPGGTLNNAAALSYWTHGIDSFPPGTYSVAAEYRVDAKWAEWWLRLKPGLCQMEMPGKREPAAVWGGSVVSRPISISIHQ